jgi:fatty-acyl-CoA synthase
MIGIQLTINAARYPTATALVFGQRRYSYTALNERACRLANALAALGIGRGDHVASLVNNCNQFVEIFFALAKLGAVFIPLNFRLAPREVAQLLANCLPKVLFAGTSVERVVADLRGCRSFPRHLVWVSDQPLSEGNQDTASSYEAWLQTHPADEPDLTVGINEVQLLIHSSGTTGLCKAAIWTHGTTLGSSLAKIIDFGLTRHDSTVVCGPLFHVGPLMDLAVPILLRGGTVVIESATGFEPARLFRTVSEERATVVTIYPTMWRRVLASSNLDAHDVSSLRLLFTGGEAMPIQLLRAVYSRFGGAGFINTYGSTEGGPITTFLSPEDNIRKIGSVGKPAFSVDVRVADDNGRVLQPGKVGELLVRSPFVFCGYWGDRETESFLRHGWWHTGDLAWRDDEGFIWIAGRKKDMIISGAENIYPIEVEQVIANLDGVADVAVVGVPDEEWGEAVAAYVVKAPGADLETAEVVEHCKRNLASYKKPRHVIFVESLPRTTVNKISKDILRAQFAAASS